ncbi:MAG TPA: 50S ribosomal protein L10 [Candidatus Babeliales bacterium]|nr:50S ribosomal protein L10 [Candidatus Babeliales bacterium]
MNRQEKEKTVSLLRANIIKSHGIFLVDYRGLSVPKMEALRNALRKQNGVLKIAKARLMKKAVEGKAAYEPLNHYLKNQVGLVFASNDVPSVAKVLHTFAQENEGFDIIVGNMDQRMLPKEAVIAVASLPSREVLLAKICGLLKAPIASLAYVLSCIEKQKQAQEAPTQ